MPDATVTPPCARHAERTSVATCSRCAQPLCVQCRIEDVASERIFCSERCLEAAREVAVEQGTAGNKTLRAGLKKPIRTGWALWVRSVGPLLGAVLPVAVVGGSLWWYMFRLVDPGAPELSGDTLLLILTAMLLLVGAYGVALVGILLSQRHTGLADANPHAKAARRLIPWLTTWLLVIVITMAGYIALIVPGFYLALRLFWADEYALVHDKGPIAALKASWELTRKAAGPVFHFQFILGFALYLVIFPTAVILTAGVAAIAALGWSSADRLSIAETLLFAFVGLLAYSAMHAPEIVQFYGMRAARASLDSGELERRDWFEREKNRPL